MKNSIKVTTLGLLVVGMLAGCNQQAPNWKSEDQDLMKEHLYGVVLPYLAKDGLKVTWSAKNSEIQISGARVEGTELADYAAKYTVDNGWVDVSSEYDYTAGTFYAFEKAVETTGGNRWLTVTFHAETKVGAYAKEGSFKLSAKDIYVYSFPTKALSDYATKYYSSSNPVPAINADRYWFDEEEPYYIFCYLTSNAADGGYGEILRTAGWDVKTRAATDKYFTAVSPDKLYSLIYDYKGGELLIQIDASPVWPATTIAAFITANADGEFTVPALEGEGLTYQTVSLYIESYNELDVYAYGATVDTYEDYLHTLRLAGWTVKETSEISATATFLVAEVGQATIAVDFDDDYSSVDFEIYGDFGPLPGATWPEGSVSRLFRLYGFEEYAIPAFESAEGAFTFEEDDMNAIYVAYGYESLVNGTVTIDGSTKAEYDAYLSALTAAGWVVTDETVQPNEPAAGEEPEAITEYAATATLAFGPKEAKLELGYFVTDSYATVTIYPATSYAKTTTWPAQEIAKLAGEYVTDTVPAFTGANEGFYILKDSYGTAVQVLLADEEDETAAAAITSYQTTLTDAGYTLQGQDTYGDNYYYSPNNQLNVSIYVGTPGSVTIDFSELPGTSWDAERLNAEIEETFGSVPSIALPSVTGAVSYKHVVKKDQVRVAATFETAEAAEAACATYEAALTTAGFTPDVDEYGYNIFFTPEGDFRIEPWASGTLLYIDVYHVITEYIPSDVADVLGVTSVPLFDFTGASIVVEFDTAAYIQATYETHEAAQAGFDANIALLSGFEQTTLYGMTVYYNDEIAVTGEVGTEEDGDELVVYLAIYRASDLGL